jgi:hypothetical protein
MGVSSISSSTTSTSPSVSTETDQADALKTVLSALENQKTLLDVLNENDSSSSYDLLDLSSASTNAADTLEQLLTSASTSNVQTSVNQLSSSIQEKINKALTEAGIDTSEEIELQVDAEGNLVVTNDNAQADEIEAVLNGDSALKSDVVEYLNFMEAMAPTLTSSSSSNSSSNSTLEQLLALLGESSECSVALALEGEAMETTYTNASGDTYVLAEA